MDEGGALSLLNLSLSSFLSSDTGLARGSLLLSLCLFSLLSSLSVSSLSVSLSLCLCLSVSLSSPLSSLIAKHPKTGV